MPIELTKNKKTIYLLNILDHFSKYLISFKIANKKGKTISEKLDICFKKFGCPEQIGTDNGSEFSNKHVKILLNKYNIKLIKGKPYNQHSQGTVERVHKTVKTMLICKYLENKQKFNLENSLKLMVDIYNDTKYRTTLYKPNEIFNCSDEEILGTVKKNTPNTSKNYNSDIKIFNKDDSILLFNNFGSNFIKKRKVFILEKSKIKKKILYLIFGKLL